MIQTRFVVTISSICLSCKYIEAHSANWTYVYKFIFEQSICDRIFLSLWNKGNSCLKSEYQHLTATCFYTYTLLVQVLPLWTNLLLLHCHLPILLKAYIFHLSTAGFLVNKWSALFYLLLSLRPGSYSWILK